MDEDKRLVETSWWEGLAVGKTGSCSGGQAMLSKSLIHFSVDGRGCVPSLLFGLRPNYSRGSVQFSLSVMSDSLRPHGL